MKAMRAGRSRSASSSGADRVDAALVEMRVADMGFGGRLELGCPARQVLAQRRLRLLVDRGGELADLAGEHDEVERADRRRLRLVADGVDGAADAGDALAQPLPERPQLAAVVGQCRQAFLEDGHDVEQAVEIALEEGGGRHRPFVAGGGDGDQMAGEIAAVDARYVERQQRPQRPRVVPVVEMAAMGIQLLDGGDRRFEPLGRPPRG